MKAPLIFLIGCLLVLITGCATSTNITNAYPLKLNMTEENAVNVLNHYLSSTYPKINLYGTKQYQPGLYSALDSIDTTGYKLKSTGSIVVNQNESIEFPNGGQNASQTEIYYHFAPAYENSIDFSKVKRIELTRQPEMRIMQMAWVKISGDSDSTTSPIGHRIYLDDHFKSNNTNILSETFSLGFVTRPSDFSSQDTLIVSALLALCHNAK